MTTANQRFPIFFAEKRPFFLERIDIFRSGLDVVNTRAIVDPDVAVKLTGRRGRNTFGVLYASDNAPGNYSKDERQGLLECRLERLKDPTAVCDIERFVDKNAHIGILRVKRDVGSQHNLGFFATTYNFIERHNDTAGFDGRFRLEPENLHRVSSPRHDLAPAISTTPTSTGLCIARATASATGLISNAPTETCT